MDHVQMRGFTDYNKASAAAVGILLGCLIFDSETLFAFRPKIWDLPIIVWCICPFLSSIENGLGAYDGLSAMAYQTTFWGLPYFIGRLYFSDLAGLRELAEGIVIGGLLYVPLCWFEIRFSPQLHRIVYGHHQHEFGQSVRYGAYRPMVFMQHGLAVGMWMASATVTAFWLFLNRTVPRLMGMPMVVIFLLLIVTTVFCRSMGAITLMFVGIGVLTMTRFVRWPVWVIALALAPSAYMYLRGSDIWDGRNLVKQIAQTDPRGAASLAARIQSENLLVHHALKRPIFGWGLWNRFRIVDEEGNDQAVPDGLWVIALGHNGLVGLVAVTAVLTLPLLLLAWRIPVELWAHVGAAPAAAMAVIPALYMCDNLMNAMVNPIFILCAAGVSGLAFSLRQPQSQMQVQSTGQQARVGAGYQGHPLARGGARTRELA
ncbi:MAG: O-antigen ligase domain-containing protein [Planctomycetota bacterium]|nr:O-antigen ligase domain-containing protein [Planctomycetota bacterium]